MKAQSKGSCSVPRDFHVPGPAFISTREALYATANRAGQLHNVGTSDLLAMLLQTGHRGEPVTAELIHTTARALAATGLYTRPVAPTRIEQ